MSVKGARPSAASHHAGKDAEVVQLRRSFQETMSSDLITVVERLMRSGVQAFMSASHIDPEAAAEIFLLDRKVGALAEGPEYRTGGRPDASAESMRNGLPARAASRS